MSTVYLYQLFTNSLAKSLKMKHTAVKSKVKNTQNVYGQFLKKVEVDVVFKKLQLAISKRASRKE